jgi:hypothetical protein
MQVLFFGELSPVFPVKCEPEGRYAGNFQVAGQADLESLAPVIDYFPGPNLLSVAPVAPIRNKPSRAKKSRPPRGPALSVIIVKTVMS